MALASPTLEPTCPFPWPTPPWFLLGQISGTAPRRSAAWYLAVFNKSDAVQTSPFLLNRTKTIKSLTLCVFRLSNTFSSSMQSHPHDTSRGYSYQRHHHQTSLSSTHSPDYMDHAAQPGGYQSVVQNAQVQRSTYGHPQDHHHPGMPHPSPIPVNFHSHECKQHGSPATPPACKASPLPSNQGHP
jgi:hypothetical protein